MTNAREVVLLVGAEGGGITLYGIRGEEGWRFSFKMTDQTPFLLDGREIVRNSAVVSSWGEALKNLDRYPWSMLSPIRVHPEFRQAVWCAVQERYVGSNPQRDLASWRDRCDVEA